ncbi:DUF58 domain-containing protein [archaeon]|nr:DUF58 domain-containing protein [archaeon]
MRKKSKNIESENSSSNEKKGIPPEIKNLMQEVDANVKKLIDIFRFVLKYKIIFKGQGVEFAGIRQYTESDDAKMIDWKVSARMSTSGKIDKLYVKIYEEERDLDVMVLLDTSSSMLFGSQDKLKHEYAAILAATIIYAATETGDNAGLAMFNEKVHKFIPPSKESIQYYRVLETLVNKKNYGGSKNLKNAIKYATKIGRGRTMLFIISDFISCGDDWDDALKSAAAKFDGVLGIMLRDIRDSYLPEGAGHFRLSDPFSEHISETNLDKIKHKFETLAAKQEKDVELTFHKSKAGFIKYYTKDPFIKSLMNWFELWGSGR